MVTIQNRELETLEAKIRETEQLLKEQQSRSSASEPDISNGKSSPRRRPGLEGVFPSENAEKGYSSSPLSSPISGNRPSDEGFTDSSTCAATSSENEEKEEAQGKVRGS
jgi:hypothetical protein